jgi:aminoglycoside phosphotransferase (APT) family kinase protein
MSPVGCEEQLERPGDRRLHRPDRALEDAVAASEALRLTSSRHGVDRFDPVHLAEVFGISEHTAIGAGRRGKSLGARCAVPYCRGVAGAPGMTWLAECSAVALGEALRVVAPELSGYPVTVPGPAGKQDPLFHSGCVPVGDRFFVKFAWSRPAALHLVHEIGVLAALAREPAVPFLPEVVASSTDPLLLITRRVPGASLFDVVDSIDPDRAAGQLVRFMAALHHPAGRRAEAGAGPLTSAQLPPTVTTATLRDRFGAWIRPDQRRAVIRWCDWADAVLASPGPAVLVHGDLHGDNQVWDHDELRVVVDFATAGAAEPEYELRRRSGSMTWPRASAHSASTPRRHPQLSSRRHAARPRIFLDPGQYASPPPRAPLAAP